METSIDYLIKRLYAVVLHLVRKKVVAQIESGDVPITVFRDQLTSDFEDVKAKLTRLLDVPLKSAYSHLQSALNCVEHDNLSEATRYFQLCQEYSVNAFSSSESFSDKCSATRLRIMCTLYLSEHFSGSDTLELTRAECKDTLDLLFAESAVKSSIRVEFESIWLSSVSKKTRMNVLKEVSDLMATVGDHIGSNCTELKTSDGTNVSLRDLNPTSFGDHSGAVSSLVCCEGRLYSGSFDATIKVWDTTTLAEVAILKGQSNCVEALVCYCGRLYSGTRDNTINVWDLATLTLVATLTGHTGLVRSLICCDGRLYSASFDMTIKVWDLATLTEVATLTGHTGVVLAFTCCGGRLFSGSDDNTIKVWEISSLKEVITLSGHTNCVETLVCCGGRLYSGSGDHTIKVWDLFTWTEVATLTGHSGLVRSLASCGGRLYSGSYDNSIKVWDLTTLSLVTTLSGHTGCVYSLVCSGGRLYSGAGDNTIRMWFL